MSPDLMVALIVGLATGGAIPELGRLVVGWISGRAQARRSEVDRMAALLRDAENAEEEASRRERIALELLSETRRVAIDKGVPLAELPPVKL